MLGVSIVIARPVRQKHLAMPLHMNASWTAQHISLTVLKAKHSFSNRCMVMTE
jgi:hypothetical protein